MMSSSFERRAAPRFNVGCTAELAAFNGVARVRLSDISTSGCGVEVLGPVEGQWEDLKGCAVLFLPQRPGAEHAAALPVSVTYLRTRAKQTRLGLKFQSLSLQQSRSLLELIDSLVEEDPEAPVDSAANPSLNLVQGE